MQNTNTDGTEDFGSQGPQDNPEGGDAPEAGGPESLTSSDGSGVEAIDSLKPQEDSGPSGPTSVSSGLRSRGGTSYGPPKTAGAGSIESVSSASSNYDGGDNVLYNKSPKSSKSAIWPSFLLFAGARRHRIVSPLLQRKSAESKMLAAGQIPVSETTPPTKLSTKKCVVQIIAAVIAVIIAIIAIILIYLIVASHGHESDSGKLLIE